MGEREAKWGSKRDKNRGGGEGAGVGGKGM